jgi:hypothetical protein
MAFDMEGLVDFGEGAMAGGYAGAKVSGGNPYVTAAGAVGLGTLSFFGGAPGRRLEKKANKLSLASMEQDLELGELNISEGRRKRAAEMNAAKRKEDFGRLLAQYFQSKRGVA